MTVDNLKTIKSANDLLQKSGRINYKLRRGEHRQNLRQKITYLIKSSLLLGHGILDEVNHPVAVSKRVVVPEKQVNAEVSNA